MGLENRVKLLIRFRSEDDILRFVETCEKYDDAIDVIAEKRRTDAKSVLGMLLMKQGEKLVIDYRCYDNENNFQEFKAEIMEKFDVEAVPDKGQP